MKKHLFLVITLLIAILIGCTNSRLAKQEVMAPPGGTARVPDVTAYTGNMVVTDPSGNLKANNIYGTLIGGGGGSGNYPSEYAPWVDVTDATYGAIPDDATDDTAAIIAAVAATPTNGTLFFPPGTYHASSTIDVGKSIDIIMHGRVLTSLNDAPTLIIAQADYNRYHLAVDGSAIDNTAGGVAIQIGKAGNTIGVKRSRFIIRSATNRERGVKIVSDSLNGAVYHNTFIFGRIRNNQIQLSLTSIVGASNGQINGNRFHGGILEVSGTNLTNVQRTSVELNGTSAISDNNFYGQTYQVDAASSSTAKGVAIWIHGDKALQNFFYDMYIETAGADPSTFSAMLIDGGSYGNYAYGHIDSREPRVTADLVDETAATLPGMNDVNPKNISIVHAAPGGLKEVFPKTDLYAKAVADGNTFFSPGFCRLKETNGEVRTVYTGGSLGDGYVALGKNAIGRFINTTKTKKFFVRHDQRGAELTNLIVKCWDDKGGVLSGDTPQYAFGRSTEFDNNYWLSPTTDYGNAYYVANRWDGVWVTLAEDVKVAFIGIASHSATLVPARELSVSCYGNAPTPASWVSNVGPLPESAVPGQAFATIAPSGGFLNIGDIVYDTIPIADTSNGWVCTDRGNSLAAGGEPAGETQIAVDNDGDATDGYVFGVVLDNGLWHWTTIDGTPASDVITISDAVPVGRSIPDDAKCLWFRTDPLPALGNSGGPVACNTPTIGTNLTEGFEGSGYESTWTEVGTPDADYALPGTPPTGACDEGLYNIITGGVEEYSHYDHGSDIDTDIVNVDTSVWIYITSGMAAGNDARIFGIGKSSLPGSLVTAYVNYQNNGGTHQVQACGTTCSSFENISVDTWHKLTIHTDTTAASSYFQVDDGTQQAFERTGNDARYFFLGVTAGAGPGEDMAIIHDLFSY